MSAIETTELTRRFKNHVAVDHLNLQVQQGRIFGLIGSNGAGKTTTVRMLTTLLNPTSGTARINGVDIRTHPAEVRKHIGYVPQEAQADEALTGREHLLLQGRLYGVDQRSLKRRIDEVVELVGLKGAENRRALEYSAGMRKLLDVATGLLHQPRVLFIDEPTSGIDVGHRHSLLDHIENLPAEGTTVFLTSHFLEEVEQLAQDVALLHEGKMLVQGSPAGLKASIGSSILDITLRRVEGPSAQDIAARLRNREDFIKVVAGVNRLKIFGVFGDAVLPEVREILTRCNASVRALTIAQPTLDDVFFYHIGQEIG